jgi:hypothetical protein
MHPDNFTTVRVNDLLRDGAFHVYRSERLPLLTGPWEPFEAVMNDAIFSDAPKTAHPRAIFGAVHQVAMSRLLDAGEWDGSGAHHVAILRRNKTFTLAFAVVTPAGVVFTVSAEPLASLEASTVRV